MQMIHPHYGYLCNFKTRGFNWEEMLSIYENQLVSSYERTIGQELLADELAALSYWLLEDETRKGYLTLNELKSLLEV